MLIHDNADYSISVAWSAIGSQYTPRTAESRIYGFGRFGPDARRGFAILLRMKSDRIDSRTSAPAPRRRRPARPRHRSSAAAQCLRSRHARQRPDRLPPRGASRRDGGAACLPLGPAGLGTDRHVALPGGSRRAAENAEFRQPALRTLRCCVVQRLTRSDGDTEMGWNAPCLRGSV